MPVIAEHEWTVEGAPMGWQDEYAAKMRTPEEAAQLLEPGDILYTPIGGDARTLMPALFARVVELGMQVKIRACSATPSQEWFLDDYAELGFDLSVEIFSGQTCRIGLEGKRADFYPNLFSNQFNVYDHRRDEVEPIDVFTTLCTPPDQDGYVTFGGMPWHKGDFVRRARTSILEVCPWLPNIRTTERLHVSEVTAFVQTALTEKPPVAPREPTAETITIAGFVNQIIGDGDTIQVGAGRTATFLVPAGAFDGKRDLGWHSEITPRGVVQLMMDGVINGSRKVVDHGVSVTTTVSPSTPEEEAWLTAPDAPIETRPVREVNSIINVAAQTQMTAINNAFTVDLTGQICSESLGTTTYNGTGGQPEFHIGAVLSPGGKAITVLPSSATGGMISRIIPRVEDGQFVTVPRSFADYVVTEYGIARLAGKSQRQRARELIAIAHPDHRGDLDRALQSYYYPSGTVSRAMVE
jgi:4-hydroxybutyrate CoA-transferase